MQEERAQIPVPPFEGVRVETHWHLNMAQFDEARQHFDVSPEAVKQIARSEELGDFFYTFDVVTGDGCRLKVFGSRRDQPARIYAQVTA